MKRREPLPDLAHVLDDAPHPFGAAARSGTAGPIDDVGFAAPRPPPPSWALPVKDKRIHNRFDKAFPVMIGSELYGDTFAIARNLSAGGILVEMTYAPPLGTIVTVHFQHVRGDDLLDELVARAEVKHHHYLNFTTQGGANDAAGARAIGLRFVEFIDADERIAPERLH